MKYFLLVVLIPLTVLLSAQNATKQPQNSGSSKGTQTSSGGQSASNSDEKNIEKYPNVFAKIINEGHSVGNHTFNHLNGWKTSTEEYLENAKLCEVSISNLQPKTCNLFRPPYGKIKTSQAKKVLQLGYKIIMWEVLSADFDIRISPEKCLKNVLNNVKSGSIIVFHDSVKAFPNLEYTLPKTLENLTERGFVFDSIN